MEKTKKQRDMNFELLRVISMLLIIASHYILYSGILDNLEMYSFNYIFIDIIRVLTRISVNLYILITGYYMIISKVKIKKAINIWVLTIFYSIIMLIASILVGIKPGIKGIIKSCTPFSSGIYWFVTAYLAMYILTPFINKLLISLNKKQYKILIFILFILIVLVKTIYPTNTLIESSGGASIVWLIYLYMIGGYIRLHWDRKINKLFCLTTTMIIAILISGIRILSNKVLKNDMGRLLYSCNILNFISTICFFLYFKEVKIKKQTLNKIIGKLASSTFAVYLVHNNPFFRTFLYEKIMGTLEFVNSPLLILHFLISILGIFAVCVIIDLIRQKLFDIIGRTKLLQIVGKQLDILNEKFWDIMEEKNEGK